MSNTSTVLLEHHLKELKLPTFLILEMNGDSYRLKQSRKAETIRLRGATSKTRSSAPVSPGLAPGLPTRAVKAPRFHRGP